MAACLGEWDGVRVFHTVTFPATHARPASTFESLRLTFMGTRELARAAGYRYVTLDEADAPESRELFACVLARGALARVNWQ